MQHDLNTVLNSPQQKWARFLHKTKALWGRRHKDTVAALVPYIPANAVIFDVGGNFGYFAKEFARLHKGSCTIISFEPVTYNYSILKDVTKPMKNVRIENFALSNAAGDIEITIPIKASGKIGPALAHFGAEAKRSYIVETVHSERLDDYVARNGISRIDFMKIDVEGAEALVLEGGQQTLAKHKPSIFCEINDDYTQRLGRLAKDVVEMMKGLGYQVWRMPKKGKGQPQLVTEYTGGGDYLFTAG